MTEELEQLLKNLKLRRMLEIYDEQLRAAKKEDVTYSELLTRLARAQWHAPRRERWSGVSSAPTCRRDGHSAFSLGVTRRPVSIGVLPVHGRLSPGSETTAGASPGLAKNVGVSAGLQY